MKPHQEKAWDCLTKQEQDSLMLTLSQGMSTWQVSEALGISHYKYLELKARSEKFFRLFSDYFELHPSLVPSRAPIGERFVDYIEGCILKRLPKVEAIIYAGDSSWHLKEIHKKQILYNMENLRQCNDKWVQDFYALIMEFDRWNNFRILPTEIQAPSAYKRRSLKKYKIYIKFLFQIPDFKIKALIKKYHKPGGSRMFVGLVSTMLDDGYMIMQVSKNKNNIAELTKQKIYVFSNKSDAESFALMASRFYHYTQDIKSGQIYWATFQDIIEKAVNYKEINHLDFTNYALESALNIRRKSIREIANIRKKQREELSNS